MVALTNYAILIHQHNNINSEKDLDKFDKSVKALKYTTIVDIALGLICAVGSSLIAPPTAVLAVGLYISSLVFCISGYAMLRSDKSINDLASAVHSAWRAHVQLEKTREEAIDARAHAQEELQRQEKRHLEESIINDKARQEIRRLHEEEHAKQMALIENERQLLRKAYEDRLEQIKAERNHMRFHEIETYA